MSLKDALHVLVVDDMATSRGLIVQSLTDLGIKNVSWERSGDDAFRSLQNKPVHLIISDQNMPGMTGLQLLHAVRSYAPLAKTGFILVTGSPDPKILQQGVQIGLNNYLTKPFNTAQMKACVERVVGRLG
ncbi:MAG: response regulator [Pseudomonadota bacterium]